jgi:elongator complex protein 3
MESQFNPKQYEEILLEILTKIKESDKWDSNSLQKILKKYPKDNEGLFRNDELVAGYRYLLENRKVEQDKRIENRIRLKPVRTSSGVATVTVLTKPYPCPGTCIFCPNDPNMPKSYISSEPGAQRALSNRFDPYTQVLNRLIALNNIGHNIEKVELLILGGSWSAYQENYKLWFIKRCFEALNHMSKDHDDQFIQNFSSEEETTLEELEKEQLQNETAYCRNVGLVLETRPDLITEKEIIDLKRFGATKIQIGVQSLDNKILELNKIGRDERSSRNAFKLLRLAGFKIHAHWMPNLYGSTVERDIQDYKKLWNRHYCPDELKIYPTSIIENTYLYRIYKEGKYQPYTEEELLQVLIHTIPNTPRYCRLSRIIRDIPSDEIVDGNKKTNMRQIAEKKIIEMGGQLQDIRSREIRNEIVIEDDLKYEEITYQTTVSKEYFLSYRTKETDRICGFLRLSIPKKRYSRNNHIEELRDSSIIREVHVYGKVVGISKDSTGEAQHLGLGKKLINKAENMSKMKGYSKINVISAIGTREYYKKRGFERGDLYMFKNL